MATTTTDTSVQITLLHHIQSQMQSSQRHISWDYTQPISDVDKQRRLKAVRLGVYGSVPLMLLTLWLQYISLPSDVFPIMVVVVLVMGGILIFGCLPYLERVIQQRTHQDVRVTVDRQRQRVTVETPIHSGARKTYAFHAMPADPSDLHLLGGVPPHPTAEHMQLYRDVQSALQHTTGLVFV